MKDNILIALAWLVIISGTLLVHSQEFEDELIKAEMAAAEAGTDKYLIKEDIMVTNQEILDLGLAIYEKCLKVKTPVHLEYNDDVTQLEIKIQGYVDSLTEEELEHPRYGTYPVSNIEGVNEFLIDIMDLCDNKDFIDEVDMEFYYNGDSIFITFK